MPAQSIKLIPLEDLLVDLFNPRHAPQTSQREAISHIARDQGMKLLNLAQDIVDKGLNPSDLPLVTPSTQDDGTYTVLEGNRRIAALKLASNPQLVLSIGLSKAMTNRFQELHADSGSNIPTEINCAILSPEDAKHWIHLKHTGENEGVGVVQWDGRARQRFRGSSPALQAIELVEAGDYLDEQTKSKLPKIAITNIERVLNTPDARKHLGVDVVDKQLVIVGPNEEEALGRLAILVSAVANREIRVTDLDSKAQRVDYAQRVAAMPLPQPAGGGNTGTASGGGSSARSGSVRSIRPDRKTLIPRNFQLKVTHTRLNHIFHELKKLKVDEFVNCSAVMLRVFIELSVDHYANKENIPLVNRPRTPGGTPQDMKLIQKISTVSDFLLKNGICSRGQLQGIRVLLGNSNNVLSVATLHAYVHNKDYYPTATDLKTTWNNIEPFVQALWS